MEALNRLENSIDNLLTVLKNLKQENERLQAQLDSVNREKAILEEQKISLQTAVQKSENIRENILQRVDHILQKLSVHDSIGQDNV